MRRPLVLSLGAALLGALPSAAGSGLLVPDAAAQVARRRDDDDRDDARLVLDVAQTPADGMLAHRSHQSHRSHRSHYSGNGHYSGYGASEAEAPEPQPPQPPPPPPPPPQPARVSFLAFPGGRIWVDGVFLGQDATAAVVLTPGRHEIKIVNRFLGEHRGSVDLSDGQTGVVTIEW